MFEMNVFLPDHIVDEANGEYHDSDWNELNTTDPRDLALSLCILLGLALKQTEESNYQHNAMVRLVLQTSGMVQEV